MTLSGLSDFLYDLAAERFPESSVLWAEQYNPNHKLPQTTIKLKDVTVPLHPVQKVKDGKLISYYECTKILEINRYANSVAGGAGEISTLENPAVDDLTLFLLFLQSEVWAERAYAANICIESMGPVRDLSELDRTRYRYRAMQEYTVRFILEYEEGKAAVHNPHEDKGWEQAAEPIGYFEEVEGMEETYE